jgi:hypothetical protein
MVFTTFRMMHVQMQIPGALSLGLYGVSDKMRPRYGKPHKLTGPASAYHVLMACIHDRSVILGNAE